MVAALARFTLREDIFRPNGPLKVDRDKGVIYGVKVLGWESANKRRYLPEAVKKALPLYEGAKVYHNHPDKPNQSRKTAEGFGKLSNCRVESDGLYADLLYFKTDAEAGKVTEDVERGIGFFGLSHNADGLGERQGDVVVIHEITAVTSVDLVTDPATVTNLWESKGSKPMKKLTIKKLLECVKDPKTISVLKEMDDMGLMGGDAEMPVADEPETMSHEEALMAAAHAALDDGELAPDEKLSKIKDVFKLLAKADAGDEEPVEEEDDSEKDKPDDKGDDSKKESKKMAATVNALQERLDRAELAEFIREECDKRSITTDKALMEGLVAMKDRRHIKAHLDYLKKITVPAKGGAPQKRSQQQGGSYHTTESKAPTDGKSFAAAIK